MVEPANQNSTGSRSPQDGTRLQRDLTKKAKGGSFKTLNLPSQLYHNIPFDNPTPIQRKTIPLILEKRSLLGIARTGSGKTLCYLIPAIINAINNENTLILLPTKELVFQVKSVLKMLSYRIEMTGSIQITTLRDLEIKNISLLVVDEVDRILEEPSLLTFFNKILEQVTGNPIQLPSRSGSSHSQPSHPSSSYSHQPHTLSNCHCQRIYFSATLPDSPLDINVVQVENKIPESIKHYFFYVPSESKESALLNLLNKEKKTIIFVSTKYGVDFLLSVLDKYNYKAKGIYSSMDDDARRENFSEFMAGKVKILIVTDVAARGIDIPYLDVSISFDLSDKKTFVHRVGRIRGMGEQYSFVTYSDVFHFFNIKETHLPETEIGTIPQNLLDKFDLSDLAHLKFSAIRGYQRCLDFRRRVSVPSEFKSFIDNFEVHSFFKSKETLADQIKKLKARKIENVEKKEKTSFKDQFYIPYSKNESRTHSSAFSISKDDYLRERAPSRNNNGKNRNNRRRTSPIGNQKTQ